MISKPLTRLIALLLILPQATYGIALPHLPVPQNPTINLINNKGDVGRTLDALGKEENIKALAMAMVTAGALAGLDKTLGMQGINAKSDFSAQLGKNLINNTASATIDVAINGGSLEDKLNAALKNAFIDTGAAQGANLIGDLKVNGKLNEYTNHYVDKSKIDLRTHLVHFFSPVEEVVINGRKWYHYFYNASLYPDALSELYVTGLAPDRYLEIHVRQYPVPPQALGYPYPATGYPTYPTEDQMPGWMKKTHKYKEQLIHSLRITKPEGSTEPDLYEVESVIGN